MERVRFSFPNEKVAFLWPDHPFVLAGSIVLDEIVSCLDKQEDVDNISKKIATKYGENLATVRNYVINIRNSIQALEENHITPDLHNLDGISMATFNLTKACNLNCRHCYANASPNSAHTSELSEHEIEYAISNLDKIVSHQPRLLIFSGGEPTLKISLLIHAIKCAYDFGFNVRLNTNGIIMPNELIQVLKECNVLTQISIDGINEDSHGYLRGNKYSFIKAKETLYQLTQNGCRVRVSMTTHAKNYEEIPDVFMMAADNGAEQFITSNLVVSGRAQHEGLKPVSLSKEFNVIYNLVKDNKKYQLMTKSTLLAETINAIRAGVKFINCGSGLCTCCVDSDGYMYPCINMIRDEFQIASILENNIKNVWRTSPIIAQLKSINVDTINKQCASCVFRYFCGSYCRGETISAGENLYSPYIRCSEWKQALIKILEILSNTPDIYYFDHDAISEVLMRE